MKPRAFSIIGLNILAASAAASVIVLILSLTLLAAGIDLRERKREIDMARTQLAQLTSDLEERLGSYANSDLTLANLDNRFDPIWAQQVLVSPFENDVTSRLLLVLDENDEVVFAREHARPAALARQAVARRAASGLVSQIRALEAAHLRKSAPSMSRSGTDWVVKSATVLLQGQPTLINAGLVAGDVGAVTLRHAHAPIIIYTSDLQAVILPMLQSRVLLHDPFVVRGALSPGVASFGLTDAGGQVCASIGWIAGQPAKDLLLGGLAPLAITIAALAGAVLIAYRQGMAGSRLLQESEAKAHHLATHDGLTGLPNRLLLHDRITQALSRGARHGGDVAMLLLDLDRFKVINDAYGHQCGDELIREVSRRLRRVCRQAETCARLGGDEFVVLAENCAGVEAAVLAKRLAKAMTEPVQLEIATVTISASIGISLCHNGVGEAAEMLRQADLALYKAKETRDTFRFFELEMDNALRDRRELESDLRAALKAKTLMVVYQLQFEGSHITGAEALVRWTHPQRGPISPSFFVGLAEECGLIEALGDFVLNRAFADSRRWPGLKVSINVSATQLRLPGFMATLQAAMRAHDVQADSFELEITEGVLMADDLPLRDLLATLRSMGFTLSLDDFGTGYSSLSYLRRFPIDKIKIDRSFTAGIADDPVARSITLAIVNLATALHLDLIAEGVETEQQRSILAGLGCHKIQGFLMSRPAAAEVITTQIQTVANGRSQSSW